MTEDEKLLTSIRGRVHNELGNPIGGINLSLNNIETKTLFDGTYSFIGLSSGAHIIRIVVNGYITINKRIELNENESASVDLYLEKALGNSKIYGYVIDDEKKIPINQGGSIYLALPMYNLRKNIDPTTGYFEFLNLPEGTYNIWTSILEFEENKKTITIGENVEKEIDFYIKKKKETEPLWG